MIHILGCSLATWILAACLVVIAVRDECPDDDAISAFQGEHHGDGASYVFVNYIRRRQRFIFSRAELNGLAIESLLGFAIMILKHVPVFEMNSLPCFLSIEPMWGRAKLVRRMNAIAARHTEFTTTAYDLSPSVFLNSMATGGFHKSTTL
jgi:hypothetical protein